MRARSSKSTMPTRVAPGNWSKNVRMVSGMRNAGSFLRMLPELSMTNTTSTRPSPDACAKTSERSNAPETGPRVVSHTNNKKTPLVTKRMVALPGGGSEMDRSTGLQ